MRHAALLMIVVAALAGAPAEAATIVVNVGDQVANGTCTLSAAVDAANTNGVSEGCTAGSVGEDMIQFDPAIASITFTQPISGTVDALRVTEALVIDGGANRVLLRRSGTLDDNTPFRLIHAYNPQVLLQAPQLHLVAVRFENGLANGFSGDDADGGCLLIRRGALSMTDVTFTACRAVGATGNGGAVAQIGNGDPDLPTLDVAGCTFEANVTNAGSGGALYTESPDVDIVDSTFRDNLAGSGGVNGQGGGLFVFGNPLGHGTRIERSTFAGNRAMQGGGGLYLASPGLLRNVTVSDNSTSTGNGGGITFGGGGTSGFPGHPADITIENSTIAGNSAGDGAGTTGGAFAGGVYCDSPSTQAGALPLRLDSVLFTDNTARYNNQVSPRDLGAQFQITAAGANNLSRALGTDGSNYNVVFAIAPLSCDPHLAPLAANGGSTPTRALLAGSCALDAGSNPDALPTDQRGAGFPRVLGSTADIGAFEGTSDVIFADGFEH